jgi:adenylate kinase family enzyme
MTEENGIPPASKFRAYLDDDIDKQRDSDAVAAAAYIDDDDARQLYLRYRRAFENREQNLPQSVVEQMPQTFEETEIAKQLIEKYASDQARRAISQGDDSKMAWQQGITSYEAMKDGTYYQDLSELWEADDGDSQLNLMIYAPKPPRGTTGVGKTDFAYRLIEEALIEYPQVSVSSNIRSDQFRTTENWSDTKEWIENESGEKVVLLDEAAQFMQFADQKAGKILSQMIKLMRKYNTNLILIAHTGVDVPKDIRRQVLMARKLSKKKVRVGQGISETAAGEYTIQNLLLEMEEIRETRLEYDTRDTAQYEFNPDEDGDAETNESEHESLQQKAQEMRDEGMSVRAIGDEIGKSRTWVSENTTT